MSEIVYSIKNKEFYKKIDWEEVYVYKEENEENLEPLRYSEVVERLEDYDQEQLIRVLLDHKDNITESGIKFTMYDEIYILVFEYWHKGGYKVLSEVLGIEVVED